LQSIGSEERKDVERFESLENTQPPVNAINPHIESQKFIKLQAQFLPAAVRAVERKGDKNGVADER
jgi:hypothetical protein